LTNCLKHAGPAHATVSVDFGTRLLSLVVTDDGRGAVPAQAPAAPGGHGLIGMRERVAMYGGSLWAGPRRGGGYDVIAQLPLDRDDAAPDSDPVGRTGALAPLAGARS
jgi:signal transduction histidine kinase